MLLMSRTYCSGWIQVAELVKLGVRHIIHEYVIRKILFVESKENLGLVFGVLLLIMIVS